MREFSDCEDRLEAIADLPPSAKLVFKTIQYNERLTHDQLSNRTQLSGRTLRDVIARLRNLGVLTVEVGREDGGQPVYAIASDHANPHDEDNNEGADDSTSF